MEKMGQKMEKEVECGIFCEIYGDSIRNRMLEYLLENQDLDFAVGDAAKAVGISRPKAYEIINELESKEYVQKSRVIGKTQLYKLNKNNGQVKLLKKTFSECLRAVIKQNQENDIDAVPSKKCEVHVACCKRI